MLFTRCGKTTTTKREPPNSRSYLGRLYKRWRNQTVESHFPELTCSAFLFPSTFYRKISRHWSIALRRHLKQATLWTHGAKYVVKLFKKWHEHVTFMKKLMSDSSLWNEKYTSDKLEASEVSSGQDFQNNWNNVQSCQFCSFHCGPSHLREVFSTRMYALIIYIFWLLEHIWVLTNGT